MRQNLKKLLVSVAVLCCTLIYALPTIVVGQTHQAMGLRVGGVYFDAQPDPGDILQSQSGSSFQTDIYYRRAFDWGGNISPTVRGGYSLLFELTSDIATGIGGRRLTDRQDYHYAHLGYGLQWQASRKIGLTVEGVHYLFLPIDLYNTHQRRSFMNIELGAIVRTSSQSYLSIASPLSITRILVGNPASFLLPSDREFVPAPEMNGLYIGWHYTL